MKIKEVEIKKFRNLSGISISFGGSLNAIAGQNGVSKTSLLGLLGHLFTYSPKYKTLLGKNFSTNFSEIFRFAFPDYDKAGDHSWVAKFDNRKDAAAISYARKEKGKEDTIRIRVGESKRGEGKIKFPVIYLGMGRLFPLALEENIRNNKSELNEEEAREYARLHNEILLITEDTVQPESIAAFNKSFYAAKTDKYNHLGNSAGQDNLGQIITALLSFKRLQKDLGDKYRGGILIIDELDASLFPAAQMKLVQKLSQKSKELNLQIFFTTHSLEVLSQVQKCDNSESIILDNRYGPIEPKYNPDLKSLQEALLVEGPDAYKDFKKKKYVYCEDEEAVDMLKNILPKEIRQQINIFPTKLGDSVLKEIAKKKIPDFKNSLIILDGDSSSGSIKNVVTLPGKSGPDRIIYDFLWKLDASDSFWKKKQGYHKQFCFSEFNNLQNSDQNNRRAVKKWYLSQRSNWGNLGSRAWKLWVQENQDIVDIFIEDFQKLV